MRRGLYLIFSMLFLTACAGNPVKAVPVTGFDADQYLGTWYEVARLDHGFDSDPSTAIISFSILIRRLIAGPMSAGVRIITSGCSPDRQLSQTIPAVIS